MSDKSTEESLDRFLRRARKNRSSTVRRRVLASRETLTTANGPNVYKEASKNIPITQTVDILVVGGGGAGIMAAVAAKRASPDLDVLLIEREEYLGGTITRVGMESVSWWKYDDAKPARDLVHEIEKVAYNQDGLTKFPYNDGLNFTAEPFKRVADDFVTREGVRVLFGALMVDTILEGSRIKGILVETIEGRQALMINSCVVDCSGNADVLHRAGGRYSILPTSQRMHV